MVSRAVAIAAGLAVVAALGCGESTMRVFVYSDQTLATTRIEVKRGSDVKLDQSFSMFEVPLPSALLLEDSGESTDQLTITVEGDSRVRRTARLDFDPDRDVVLPMPLCASCNDRIDDCGAGTCIQGQCQGIDVDEGALPEDPDAENLYELERLVGNECTGTGGSGGSGGSGGGGGTGGGDVECTHACGTSPECGECPTIDQTTDANFNFWIASFETSQGLYAAWLATNPAPGSDLPAECADATFEPDQGCLASSGCASAAELPQICVSWCAANAFCAWAGMELCYPAQWEAACRGPTDTDYPYGATYEAGRCNGDSPEGCPAPSNAQSTCRGGFVDAYDLSGNVAEWVNDCSAGCSYRGGDHASPPTQLDCATGFAAADGEPSPRIGFRCCVGK